MIRALEVTSMYPAMAAPQVAARMVSAFTTWKRLDAGRQALIKAQLEQIVAREGVSDNIFEVTLSQAPYLWTSVVSFHATITPPCHSFPHSSQVGAT
jgi:hypothetical protein